MPDLPAYTWSPGKRQFRDAGGRFVSRAEVRSALDPVLDAIASDIRVITEALVAGTTTLERWHEQMELLVKEAHTLSGALAAGGWRQATPDDWATVGRRVKFQYQKLTQFARELENGLTLDGSVVTRALMYGIAGTGTYESVLRRGDIKAGYGLERRILHSNNSCRRCIAHAQRGWQPAGVLPGIGDDCDCLSNCRCTFERKKAGAASRGRLVTATFGELLDFLAEFARGGGAGKRARKAKKGGTAAKKGGAGGGCGTGYGGFKGGNTCWKGGGGGGKVTAKANADAKAMERWAETPSGGLTKVAGLPGTFKVQAGPPRNAKEQKLLAKAEKQGGVAIVRTEKLSARKVQDGPVTKFYHGDDVAVTVLATKDVASVRPALNASKGYDPADYARTAKSKYTVIDHEGVVSGYSTRQKAEAVARDRITRQRKAHEEDDVEFKIVKDVNKSNLVSGTSLGGHENSLVTIRVLRPSRKGTSAFAVMPAVELDAALFGSDEEMVLRKGLIFRAGNYPNQNFSITPEELAEAVRDFRPVPVTHGHPSAPGPLDVDGGLGELRSVELSDDGKSMFGVVAIPKWLDERIVASGRRVSCAWDRETKRLRDLSLVLWPQISDAELVSAFAAARVESGHHQERTGPMDMLKAFRFWKAAGEPATIDLSAVASFSEVEGASTSAPAATPPPVAVAIEDTPEFKEAVRRATEAARRSAEDAEFATRAEAWFSAELAAGRVIPADKDRLLKRYVRLAMDDRDHPAEFAAGEPLSRLAEFCSDIARRRPHGLDGEAVGTEPVLPEGSRSLFNGAEAPASGGPLTPERLNALLAATSLGKSILVNGQRN